MFMCILRSNEKAVVYMLRLPNFSLVLGVSTLNLAVSVLPACYSYRLLGHSARLTHLDRTYYVLVGGFVGTRTTICQKASDHCGHEFWIQRSTSQLGQGTSPPHLRALVVK